MRALFGLEVVDLRQRLLEVAFFFPGIFEEGLVDDLDIVIGTDGSDRLLTKCRCGFLMFSRANPLVEIVSTPELVLEARRVHFQAMG
jgi:hypothetical protein